MSDFAVAPLRMGSGLKLKVLECLAQGVAVVATPVGGEGIPANEAAGLLVVDDIEQFTSKCLSLFNNPVLCADLGAAAARWYRDHYLEKTLSDTEIHQLIEGFSAGSTKTQ